MGNVFLELDRKVAGGAQFVPSAGLIVGLNDPFSGAAFLVKGFVVVDRHGKMVWKKAENY